MLSVPDNEGCDRVSDTTGEDECVLTEIICGMDGVTEGGTVRISNDVLAIIAGIATSEIDGVTGMASSLVESISEKFGRHDLGRGIKVETQEDEVRVDVFVNVQYGCRIPDVARSVQINVKEAIENMTDLQVKTVNVHVQEVVFSPCGEEEDEE
ncbi:MAG: Asp23/Gls24 family envelope stress response protein [Bacillota bacterium]